MCKPRFTYRCSIFRKGMILLASVNFEKLHSAGEVKAMLRHCDYHERMEHEHENKHIDKSLSRHNRQLQYSYDDTCKRYDDRIAFLDAQNGANKRSDRVTCFGLEIPLPERLDASKDASWLSDVCNILYDTYGNDNLLQIYYHADERHDYIDAVTHEHKTSRNHIHAYIIPEVGGKLNGKQFSSRKNMIALNNAIEDMTQSKYGCYFMDGSKRKSKADMKSLKHKSEALQKQEDELKEEYARKEQELQQRIEQERKQNAIESAKLAQERKSIEADRQKLDEEWKACYRWQDNLTDRENALEADMTAFNERVNNYDKEFEKRVSEGIQKRERRRSDNGLCADGRRALQSGRGHEFDGQYGL